MGKTEVAGAGRVGHCQAQVLHDHSQWHPSSSVLVGLVDQGRAVLPKSVGNRGVIRMSLDV